MKIRYLDPLERLEFELQHCQEEGLDVAAEKIVFEKLLNSITAENEQKVRREATRILQRLNKMSLAVRHSFEPDELETIAKTQPVQKRNPAVAFDLDCDEYYDRILGGWLGRAAGCLLGKPVEKYARGAIREILESNAAWPLKNYFTAQGMPSEILRKYPWKQRGGLESLRENITCMPEDDDLNYTMLNLHILETRGGYFTTDEVGEEWLRMLPVYETFTAERVAYFNYLGGIRPPESGRYLNPFREWIGAQIRADLWGYVCPGEPQKAAELAWRDARFSHVRNGIYGEMFFAAMIAAAFTESSPSVLVEIGLSVIPENSRLAKAVRMTVELVRNRLDWEHILVALSAELGHYHWVHVINNAALTVATLLFSQGDFEKTICNAVMGGWDTDCNGATAGSVIGVIQGARNLPDKWIRPLNNRIRSSLKGFDNSTFTDLAGRTVRAAQNMRDLTGKGSTLNTQDDF